MLEFFIAGFVRGSLEAALCRCFVFFYNAKTDAGHLSGEIKRLTEGTTDKLVQTA